MTEILKTSLRLFSDEAQESGRQILESPGLQIKCGSCGTTINVPNKLVEQLIEQKRFSCPKCKNMQQLGDDQVELFQRTKMGIQGAPTGLGQRFTGLPQYQQPMQPTVSSSPVRRTTDEGEDEEEEDAGETFQEYVPRKLKVKSVHPDPVVETSTLAAVEPPEITYEFKAKELVEYNLLSGLQLESVAYACQQHEHFWPDGSRCGFFIGDGAGVGKGRTIAGLILENWVAGRKKHLWISVSSDLKFDSERDLRDVGAEDIEVHALNKTPYVQLHNVPINEGVVYSTYSSLIATSSSCRLTRFKQIVQWCGTNFDGLIIYDECHKAKNLVPDNPKGEPTKTGQAVLNLQKELPNARVVYCSATGASEVRNLGYMVRLGLWGEGNRSFKEFPSFMEQISKKGVGALELIAMELKLRGMYVCRTLSYANTEFEIVEIDLDPRVKVQYQIGCRFWAKLKEVFEKAVQTVQDAELQFGNKKKRSNRRTERKQFGKSVWRYFWASHQRFFRHTLMAAKVPEIIQMTQASLSQGHCVVIGLQSTGEARTADAVLERGEELDEFVSGPKELLLKLVEDHFPIPDLPGCKYPDSDDMYSDEYEEVDGVIKDSNGEAADGTSSSSKVVMGRGARSTRAREVNYCEVSEGSESSESVEEDEEDDEEDEDQDYVENGNNETRQRKKNDNNSSFLARTSEENGSVIDLVDEDSDDSFTPDDPAEDDIQLEDCDYDDVEIVDTNRVINSSESSPSRNQAKLQQTGILLSTRSNPNLSQNTVGIKRKFESALDLYREEAERNPNLKATSAQEIVESAYSLKRKLKQEIEGLDLPLNPLDVLIDSLGGPQQVAELTGRKARLVRRGTSVKYESRNMDLKASLEMVNMEEKRQFMEGSKLIAVISDAASAGISLHADRREQNQRRRVHMTLELPWSADKAIQQFGRSHRANQASGPMYKIVFSNVGGEKRFAASVAQRLESLGALTQGDRRAGPSLNQFNYGSKYGKKALQQLYESIASRIGGTDVVPPCCEEPDKEFESPELFYGHVRNWFCKVGLLKYRDVLPHDSIQTVQMHMVQLDKSFKQDVHRFLNRLLGMEPYQQRCVFDFFIKIMENEIKQAKRDGEYVDGIFDIKGGRVEISGQPMTVYEDEMSKAKTVLYNVHVDKGVPWEEALTHKIDSLIKKEGEKKQDPEPANSPDQQQPDEVLDLTVSPSKRQDQIQDYSNLNGFYKSINLAPGKRYPVLLATYVKDTYPALFNVVRPMTGYSAIRIALPDLRRRYEVIKDQSNAERLWKNQHANAEAYCPGVRFKKYNILAGLIMPVWSIVNEALPRANLRKDQQLRIFRIRTSDERNRFAGLYVPEDVKHDLLKSIREETNFVPREFEGYRSGLVQGEQTEEKEDAKKEEKKEEDVELKEDIDVKEEGKVIDLSQDDGEIKDEKQ